MARVQSSFLENNTINYRFEREFVFEEMILEHKHGIEYDDESK